MMDEPCASVSVLFVISAKKQRHIDLQRVIKTARKYGMICDVAEVDALEAVRENTYDVIVHKVTEFAALSRQGDKKAARIIDAFKAFIASQPSSCVVVDPLARSEVLLDRELTFTKLRQCTTTHGTWRITTPTSAVIRSQDDLANLEARLSEAGVEVPVICKSVTAHGSKAAHEMCLLLSTQASPSIAPPFIAQTFVPHNAVLIKVFVVGDSFTVCHRPSIRNLQHNSATHAPLCIPFDSHDVSKPHSESHLNVAGAHLLRERVVDDDTVSAMVAAVREEFGLSLFGIDAVVEAGTHNLHVVDVNYFPGYAGVADFDVRLCRLLQAVTSS